MKLRMPNLLESTLFNIEEHMDHLEDIARLVEDDQIRAMLTSCADRVYHLANTALEALDRCERLGITQSQRETAAAEYDGAIPPVAQDIVFTVEHEK